MSARRSAGGRPALAVRLTAVLIASVLVLAACGDDDGGGSVAGDAAGLAAVDPERCAANQAAGEILFLTSFDFAAAASIIDVVVADELGYFAELCLDVTLQAGFSSANVAAVAAEQAQMTSLGSFSEVAVANASDADLLAVAVLGKTSVEALLVEGDSAITELADLPSAPMGVKGAIPYSVRAMIAEAGVDEDEITQIQVDFNPIVLFETDIESLPVYKSNEPAQLEAQGLGFRTFDPADLDIPASFAVFTTSRAFAEAHPTAVADFLRAAIRGFEHAADDPAGAVARTLARSDPEYFFSPEGETFRWITERDLVIASTPVDQPLGAIDLDALTAEVGRLQDLGVIAPGSVDVAGSADGRFVEEIFTGTELVWPAPG